VLKKPGEKEAKSGEKVAVGSVSPDGLIARWNENNSTKVIGPGDEFLSVNGKFANEDIIQELKGDMLDLVLAGPVPGTGTIDTGPNLGPFVLHGVCVLAVVNIGMILMDEYKTGSATMIGPVVKILSPHIHPYVGQVSSRAACGVAIGVTLFIVFIFWLMLRPGKPEDLSVEPKFAFEVAVNKGDKKLGAQAAPAMDGSNTLILTGINASSPLTSCFPPIQADDRIAAVNRKYGNVDLLLRMLRAPEPKLLIVRPGVLQSPEHNVEIDSSDLEVASNPDGSNSLAVVRGSSLAHGDRLLLVNGKQLPEDMIREIGLKPKVVATVSRVGKAAEPAIAAWVPTKWGGQQASAKPAAADVAAEGALESHWEDLAKKVRASASELSSQITSLRAQADAEDDQLLEGFLNLTAKLQG
jgi:hypothetical protein